MNEDPSPAEAGAGARRERRQETDRLWSRLDDLVTDSSNPPNLPLESRLRAPVDTTPRLLMRVQPRESLSTPTPAPVFSSRALSPAPSRTEPCADGCWCGTQSLDSAVGWCLGSPVGQSYSGQRFGGHASS